MKIILREQKLFERIIGHIDALLTGARETIKPRRMTIHYPRERRELPDNYRGFLLFEMEKCISCFQCAFVCPVNAIVMKVVDGRYHPSIDYAKCIFCHFCVDSCTGALRQTKIHDVAFKSIQEMFISTEELGREPKIIREDKHVVKYEIEPEFSLSKRKETPSLIVKPREKIETGLFSCCTNPENCIGCTICYLVCPSNSIKTEVVNGERILRIDKKTCNGCGLCVKECQSGVLSLRCSEEIFEWKRSMKLPEKPFDIKYFGNLLKEVIDAEICSHCATCVTICPVHGIKAGDRPIYFPDWESDCVDCGACIDVCPRWKFRPLSGIGPYLELLSARSTRREGQDGGIVTEIMAGALELGMIDKAIVVSRDEFWKTLPVHIRYAEQLQYEGFRGTKYSFADSLPEIRYAVNTTRKGIGVIGTPCMVSGLRKLQKFSGIHKKIKIIVGLFCTENFYHHQLRDFLLHKKIDIKDANKINIKKGKFILSMKNKDVSFKVEELEPIVPSGCKVCQDFTGVESDVSVGGVGSEEGFSSVIVRTEPAKIVFDYIRENDYVILGEVKKELIEKLVSFKVKIHPYPKNERRV